MSTSVFGAEYAAAYDQLYRDKDYQAECDLLERIFDRFARGAVRRLLDLGCGTGNHALPLAARGFDVVGVDRSNEMLDIARGRAFSPVRFELGDVTSVRLGESFDAALMMFAVLGYQVRTDDVTAALRTARAHLTPGGLFVCDVWYGPAVLAQRPADRTRVLDLAGGGQLIRVASGELDVHQDACLVRYRVWSIDDRRVTTETREEHLMRYFFEPELAYLLAQSGFELAHIGAFPDIDAPPDDHTWNVAIVARAV